MKTAGFTRRAAESTGLALEAFGLVIGQAEAHDLRHDYIVIYVYGGCGTKKRPPDFSRRP